MKKIPSNLLVTYQVICKTEFTHWSKQHTLDEAKFIDDYTRRFRKIVNQLPSNIGDEGIPVPLIDLIPNPKSLVQYLMYHTGLSYWQEWARAWTIINEKVDIWDKPVFEHTLPTWIDRFEGSNKQLVKRFLGNTTFQHFLLSEVNITIPDSTRTEHHHIVGGSGHGKTSALKYFIAEDIKRGNNVIVIDSQRDLIQSILEMQIPKERIVWISPRDADYPLCFNFFDVGMDRINTYSRSDREQHLNGILELYKFLFTSLMEAELTDKQALTFVFVVRLILQGGVPDPTIHTLLDILNPGGFAKYKDHVTGLSQAAKSFFETAYDTKDYAGTREQIARRIYSLLQNATMENMLSQSKSKIDIFKEMNEESGKIILIDTAADYLKEQSKFFGRCFIAMIAAAIQERSSIKGKVNRTYLYIDEAWQYFDNSFVDILRLARKFEVGMIVSHQDFGDVPPGILSALAANTSIKFAGGVSASEARSMASDMRTSSDFILSQNKLSFAAYIKGSTSASISLKIDPTYIDKLPKRTDMDELKEMTRRKYSIRFKSADVREETVEVIPPNNIPPKNIPTVDKIYAEPKPDRLYTDEMDEKIRSAKKKVTHIDGVSVESLLRAEKIIKQREADELAQAIPVLPEVKAFVATLPKKLDNYPDIQYTDGKIDIWKTKSSYVTHDLVYHEEESKPDEWKRVIGMLESDKYPDLMLYAVEGAPPKKKLQRPMPQKGITAEEIHEQFKEWYCHKASPDIAHLVKMFPQKLEGYPDIVFNEEGLVEPLVTMMMYHHFESMNGLETSEEWKRVCGNFEPKKNPNDIEPSDEL
jgi:hypothetical protein